MIIKRDHLSELDPEHVIPIENLVITARPFRRSRVRNELSHAGFLFKEYKSWWGSDFKVLGSYKVGRLIRLFEWMDGDSDIIRSGINDPQQPQQVVIVKPRF